MKELITDFRRFNISPDSSVPTHFNVPMGSAISGLFHFELFKLAWLLPQTGSLINDWTKIVHTQQADSLGQQEDCVAIS